MRKLQYIIVPGLLLFLLGCVPTSEMIDLPAPTPTVETFDCSPDDKPLINDQLAFKRILVGTTLRDEVVALIGPPEDILESDFLLNIGSMKSRVPITIQLSLRAEEQ